MKIDLTKKEKITFVIIGLSIMILPIIFTRSINLIDFSSTGSIGETIGGITAPFMSFFGSILVYLALKSQIEANDEIKNQFYKQKEDESNDFIFSNYKERINLIISEINSFNISFHDNSLISSVQKLPSLQGKKYNFVGIQAINLFLIEYFRLKTESEANEKKEFTINNSYQAIFLSINNMIGLFYRTHFEIINCKLDVEDKIELEELLKYTYYSKLNYFIEQYLINDPNDKLSLNTKYLKEFYSI
jgi:hypothetical protein